MYNDRKRDEGGVTMQDFKLIEALITERDFKKAEVWLARSLRTDLSSANLTRLLVYRARLRLLTARPTDALADLREAGITLQTTTSPELLELLADCYFASYEHAQMGFADKEFIRHAEALYSHLLDNHSDYPNRGWIHYQYGRLALILAQPDKARQAFEQALFAPSRVVALTAYCYERLGYVAFYEQRQMQTALTLLDKAVHTYPAAEPRLWLVQVHRLRSRVLADVDSSRAIEAARLALQIAEEAATADKTLVSEPLVALGELLFRQGERLEAIECLQRFLQLGRPPQGIDVTWARVYEMLGDIYFELRRYDQSLQAFQNVLLFNPYHPWEETVHYRIACCHLRLKDYAKAVSTARTIIDRTQAEGHPVRDYRLYYVLGDAWFALGKYADSTQAYQGALDTAPSTVDVSPIRNQHRQALMRQEAL
jgi:tetratricopeptide (TPR) repeat protein